MAFFIRQLSTAQQPQPIPNYGTPEVVAVSTTSTELVPAGTGKRYITLSIANDAADVFVSVGSAVNVATGNYNFIFQGGDQIVDFEVTNQAYHVATEAGTASLVLAITA